MVSVLQVRGSRATDTNYIIRCEIAAVPELLRLFPDLGTASQDYTYHYTWHLTLREPFDIHTWDVMTGYLQITASREIARLQRVQRQFEVVLIFHPASQRY